MMTAGRCSLFGCHIAHSDVAPGCHGIEVSGGGMWACSPRLLIVVHRSSVRWSLVPSNLASASCMRKGMGEVSHSPGWMWMVTTTCVITIWTTWHICWRAQSSPSAIIPHRWRGIAMLSLLLACCGGSGSVNLLLLLSVRWVGMNIWLCTYRCVTKCTTTNIVHRRLVATSLRAMWNLHSVSDRSVVGGGDLTHLGSSCPVSVCRYSPSFMSRGGTVVMVICPSLFATSPLVTWPLVVVWEEERGRDGMQLTSMLLIDIVRHCCHSSIVGCHIAIGNVAPAFLVRTWEGGWGCCLPEMMRTVMMCHVITMSHHPALVGLVMWRCHIVVVVCMQWWFGASNDGHGRWWLLVRVVIQWRWSQWRSGGGWWWWLTGKRFVCWCRLCAVLGKCHLHSSV